MATKHWVRDVEVKEDAAEQGHNGKQCLALMYHFLVNAGFTSLWECDGDGGGGHAFNPNHVPDGNMEWGDTSNYTATGAAVLAKDTSTVRSGTQSLEIDPVTGGGVESTLTDMKAPLVFLGQTGDSISGPDAKGVMTYTDDANRFTLSYAEEAGAAFYMDGSSQSVNNGLFPITYRKYGDRKVVKFYNPSGVAESYTTTTYEVDIEIRYRYEIVLWASNDDSTWSVEVDPGTGVYTSVGSIPNNGGTFTKYHFAFATEGSGSCKVRISVAAAANPIYIDSMMVFRSIFEYHNAKDVRVSSPDTSHFAFKGGVARNYYGVDGAVSGGTNQFSTGAGDSYSPGGDDIGKHLVLWDPTNNENSGIYSIVTDEGGGVVSVDMRSGTASFTAATGLSWRIIDVRAEPTYGHMPCYPPAFQRSAGFGIESPHTTKWRLFCRISEDTTDVDNPINCWSAPTDTDFDQSTGHFYFDGPSLLKDKVPNWVFNTGAASGRPGWITGEFYYNVGASLTRMYMMTDADLSFFTFYLRDTNNNFDVWGLFGYHDPDTYHPEEMGFVQLLPWDPASSDSTVGWANNDHHPGFHGLSFNHRGDAVRCTVAQFGWGSASEDIHDQSEAGVNPWSGKEWIHPFRLLNDPYGSEGAPSERDSGVNMGVFQGRYNIATFTTFDSNNYIHFRKGLVWEWMGEAVIA